MRINILKIIARQTLRNIWAQKSTRWLTTFISVLLMFALLTGYNSMVSHHETIKKYSKDVREHWLNNPDKHPHRMAHYGYIVFRQKYPLYFLDFGLDSFVGNVVFLEAHRQNTVNFSEASVSGSLLRFGEISFAIILQVLVPLLIIFLGFDLISGERENGTLKIIVTQGVTWKELIAGKIFGLITLIILFFVPLVLTGFVFVLNHSHKQIDSVVRFFLLTGFYMLFFLIIATITVMVSAYNKTSHASLIKLIGFWILFALVIPRVSQLTAQNIYPSPTKTEFDVAVEAELVKSGDSHNPNDPHFKALKDSVLKVHGVDSIHQLPFNYGGLVMREGERISAEIFNRHHKNLEEIYKKQIKALRITALINPFMAMRNLSMSLSGTDYATFSDFQNQSEKFRYSLAQSLNELQIKHITNKAKTSADRHSKISKKYWAMLPDFEYRYFKLIEVLQQEWMSILSIAGLCLLILFWINKLLNNIRIV